jgi:deoxyribodipyrimidine photo-lyase
MIQSTRVRVLKESKSSNGKYVLYWMQASQRTRFNHALEYAIERANALALPVVVCFGLMDDYPEANERHYAFMLQGLADVARNLAKRGIQFVIQHGNPPEIALRCAKDAALLVCDRGYLRHQKRWRDEVADRARCPVAQVESDVVCPVEEVSDKAEFAARTIRPKIHRIWKQYLEPMAARKVKHRASRIPFRSDIDLSDVPAALAKLKIDRSVPPSKRFEGGEESAAKLLRRFIDHHLSGYAQKRNAPVDDATSHLSAYLHFGQISPLQIALAAMNAKLTPAADRESLLEELIVRRELAFNYVQFKLDYDSFDGLPNWARQTLVKHEKDARETTYTREQLEAAETHDPYWNAAQREMTSTGFMHNYMRMYWGKKILEWKRSPREAFTDTLHLNNKYFLCGRDPNAYANVAWIYGSHDRPWGERKIFGTVRYMNAAGLERKFDMEAYVRKW